jgi:hypothetical protein
VRAVEACQEYLYTSRYVFRAPASLCTSLIKCSTNKVLGIPLSNAEAVPEPIELQLLTAVVRLTGFFVSYHLLTFIEEAKLDDRPHMVV